MTEREIDGVEDLMVAVRRWQRRQGSFDAWLQSGGGVGVGARLTGCKTGGRVMGKGCVVREKKEGGERGRKKMLGFGLLEEEKVRIFTLKSPKRHRIGMGLDFLFLFWVSIRASSQ